MVVIKRGRTGGVRIGKVEVHLVLLRNARQGGMIIALDMGERRKYAIPPYPHSALLGGFVSGLSSFLFDYVLSGQRIFARNV